MSDNKLHAVLLVLFMVFCGATFFDAVREDLAREAAAEQARLARVAALPASTVRR